jgi:glycosyltransferase involved in cell wall biosynthesis
VTASAVRSSTHLVLIPSFNTGPMVLATVRGVRAVWAPVCVVVDGSTDGTDRLLQQAAAQDTELSVLVLPRNQGKGAAVLHGLRHAAAAGFTHALTFDADGQHVASHITDFMAQSAAHPDAMILGVPVFAADAPALRVQGRRVSNWWARLESGGAVADSLFGFRVYPIAPLLAVMQETRWMRRFDFDVEAAVRLTWRGVRAINRPAAVEYRSAEQGGVSHFRYGRDNALLSFMHIRLMVAWLLRERRLQSGTQRDAVQP